MIETLSRELQWHELTQRVASYTVFTDRSTESFCLSVKPDLGRRFFRPAFELRIQLIQYQVSITFFNSRAENYLDSSRYLYILLVIAQHINSSIYCNFVN